MDRAKPLFEGGLGPGSGSTFLQRTLKLAAYACGFDLDTPFEKFPRRIQNLILRTACPRTARVQGIPFSGRARASAAVARRIGLGHLPRMADGVHVSDALYGVPRKAPAAGKPGGQSDGLFDRGIHSVADRRRACRGRKNARANHAAPTRDSPAARSGEIAERLDFLLAVGLGYLSLDRSAATLSGGEASAFVWPRRSGRSCAACSTCWTNPPSACTRATTTGCWERSSTCATSATPSWWWSTTRRPSAAPITWWTWDQARA